MHIAKLSLLSLTLLFTACTGTTDPDGGVDDGDAGVIDAGLDDAGIADAGPGDAGTDAGGEPELELPVDAAWTKLPTVAFSGKQDDVHFVDENHGWYANGDGLLYRTTNGGDAWEEVLSMPGTYWRAIGFVDENVGFLGNIGTDYFPGVTDETPLYKTTNGGTTVEPVVTDGPAVKGLCAVDVQRVEFINAGVLEERVMIHAGGRVGGPAWLLRSLDGGETFSTIDLNDDMAMITDVRFLSETVGFVVGGSSANVAASNAVILKTIDGGVTWTEVYRSERPYELIWKISFPDLDHGFATVQSYDTANTQQRIVSSTNGGALWRERNLVVNANAREFGIGFISSTTGWVGTAAGGFQTIDGGASWTPVAFGNVVNKIRIVRALAGGFVAFAIGKDLYKLDARP